MEITFQSIEQMNEEEALETVAYLVEKRGLLRARIRHERLAAEDIDEYEEEIAKLGWLINSARFKAKRLANINRDSADVPEHELRQQLVNARRQILELKTRLRAYEKQMNARKIKHALYDAHVELRNELKRNIC